MDTWATSSVTPQIACGWEDDPALFAATFPMDLRPQGPEIIRTWLFSTLLRSHLEHGVLPWRHTTINGWILDPDRKKMSKSKGNVVTPMAMLEEFGSDAVRYWACNGRPGHRHRARHGRDEDRPPPGDQGPQRLEVRAGPAGRGPDPRASTRCASRSTPRCWPSWPRWSTTATAAHEGFDYARALELTETFFWSFCDDYVELVKTRAYGEGDAGRRPTRPGRRWPSPSRPCTGSSPPSSPS